MEKQSYTRKQVAGALGITDRTVSFYTEEGLIVPEIANPTGTGMKRKYSRKNMLEILVIQEFAKNGIDLKTVKQIIKYPRTRGADGFDPWDPDCKVESDRRYYLVLYYDATIDHGRLEVKVCGPGTRLTLGIESVGTPDFTSAVVVDITNLRKKLR
jgi:DNA-binding transcriptional MerR regulator